MTSFRDDGIDPEIDPRERERLHVLMTRLENERPIPRPGFRGALRRRLALDDARMRDVPLLRRLALSCAASGSTLFAVAALGIAGVGPLAAG